MTMTPMSTVTPASTSPVKITATAFNTLRDNVNKLMGVPNDTTDETVAYGWLQGGSNVDERLALDKIYAENSVDLADGFNYLLDDLKLIEQFLDSTLTVATVARLDKITAQVWNDTITDITTAWDNRFSPAVTLDTSSISQTVATFIWDDEIGYNFGFDWSDTDNCRAFFNGGGELVITPTPGAEVTFTYQDFYGLGTTSTSIGSGTSGGIGWEVFAKLNNATAPTLVIFETVWTAAGDQTTDVSVSAFARTPQGNGSGFTFEEPVPTVNGVDPYVGYYLYSASSVDEGSSITMELNTVGVADGSYAYTVGGGVNSADFTSGFTGSFSLTGGSGTVTFGIAADATTEGPETATVSLDNGGDSRSFVINDTSQTPASSLSAPASINEGDAFSFSITITNPSAASYDWTATGTQNYNITPSSGTFDTSAIVGSGSDTFTVNIQTDEDTGSFVDGSISISITTGDSATVTVNNITAQPNNPVTGSITISGNTEVGNTLTHTENLADADGLGTFSYQWNRNGSAIAGATGTTYTTVAADVGNSITLTISYTDGAGNPESATSNSLTITAVATPTYTLSRSAASVNEGGSVDITLTTTNVSAGTVLPYTISGTGITAGDIAEGLTGSFTVGTTDSVTLNISADATTEGAETFTLTLDNGGDSISVTINDTSTPAPTATLNLQASTGSVTEGASFTYSVTSDVAITGTVDVALSGTATGGGTDYTASGATAQFTFSNSTTSDSLTIATIDDGLSEGTETVIATISNPNITSGQVPNIVNSSETVNIGDTGLPAVTIDAVRSTAAVNEGGTFSFSASASTAITGTVNFTLSGTAVNGSDYTTSGATAQFTFTNSTTSDSVTISTIADSTTEGSEFVTCTISNPSVSGYNPSLGTASRSVTINDTSTTPAVSYSFGGGGTITEGDTLSFSGTRSNGSGTTTVDYEITLSGGGTFNRVVLADRTGTLTFAADGTQNGTAATTVVSTLQGSTAGVITFFEGGTTTELGTVNFTMEDKIPTYTVNLPAGIVYAGDSFTGTLDATNAVGEEVTWTLTGTSTGTVLDPSTDDSGSFGTISADGTGVASKTWNTVVQPISPFETWTLTATGADTGETASTTMTLGSEPRILSVVPDVTSVNEGGSVTFTVNCFLIPNGTIFNWILGSGSATGADISPQAGQTSAVGGQQCTFTVNINADSLTEGVETFTVVVDGDYLDGEGIPTPQAAGPVASEPVTINDTSQTPDPTPTLSLPGGQLLAALFNSGGYNPGEKAQVQLSILDDGTVGYAKNTTAGLLPTLTTYSTWVPTGYSASDYQVKMTYTPPGGAIVVEDFTTDSTIWDDAPDTVYMSLEGNIEDSAFMNVTVEIRLKANNAVSASATTTMSVTVEP